MKKIIALLVSTLIFMSVLSSCTPRNIASDGSSELAKTDDTSSVASLEEGVSYWQAEKLSSPQKVNGFDVPVIIGGDDTDVVDTILYYNGKSYPSGTYSYIGSHNGRHYFQGYENFKDNYANYGYVCSVDENYENFERYDGLHIELGPEHVMYKGLLYSWKDGDLYSYDVATKTKKVVYDGASDYYDRIDFISDGWVYTQDNPAVNVNTGETVKIPFEKVLGTGKDGLVWGYDFVKPGYRTIKIQTYNKESGDIEVVREIENLLGADIQRDDNGDVWVQDSSSTLGYGYIKLFDFQSDDIAFSRNTNGHITNGYFYYSYSPEDEDAKYLARINLETGKTEYCPNIPFTLWHNVNPYFWGYLRNQDK